MENFFDINSTSTASLLRSTIAIYKGHKRIVELLLKNGAYINIKDNHGDSLLVYALHRNDKELVKILLKNFYEVRDKVNLNNILEELIVEKIKNKDIENALLLIINYKNRINFNFKDSECNRFLHYAAIAESYELFNLLLENKCI